MLRRAARRVQAARQLVQVAEPLAGAVGRARSDGARPSRAASTARSAARPIQAPLPVVAEPGPPAVDLRASGRRRLTARATEPGADGEHGAGSARQGAERVR